MTEVTGHIKITINKKTQSIPIEEARELLDRLRDMLETQPVTTWPYQPYYIQDWGTTPQDITVTYC